MTRGRFDSSVYLVALLTLAAILAMPEVAEAVSLNGQNQHLIDIIKGNESSVPRASEFVGAWEFMRSLINWAMVGGLLFVAFANVLRINIDTYAVKKILPTLLAGFVLANFSLFFSELFLSIASSLTSTASEVTQLTGGGPAGILSRVPVLALVSDVVESFAKLEGGNLATGAGATAIFTAIITATPAGRIIVITILILLALLPALVGLALVVIFTVRFYVLQLLILLAPVAFIGMAFPFTKNYFQTWFKMFLLWIFMEPAAHFVAAIGVMVLDLDMFSGSFATLLQYALGLGAMAFAVVVPFRMGGWIMDGVAKLGKMAFGASRLGIAGFGQENAEKEGPKGVLGKAARLVTPALYSSDIVQALRKEREEKVKTTALGESADTLEHWEKTTGKKTGLGYNVEGLENYSESKLQHQVGEQKKHVQGVAPSEKLDFMIKGIEEGNNFMRSAGVDATYEDHDRTNLHNEINKRLEILNEKDSKALAEKLMGRNLDLINHVFQKDNNTGKYFFKNTEQAKAILSASIAGARLNAEMKDGKRIFRFGKDMISRMVKRKREVWDKLAKRDMFFDESGTVDKDDQGAFIASEDHMRLMAAYNLADNDPQKVNTGMNESFLIQKKRNATTGAKWEEISGGFLLALSNGDYNYGHLDELSRFSGEGSKALSRVFSDPKRLQESVDEINKRITEAEATGKITAKEAERRRTQANTILATLYAYSGKANKETAAEVGKVVGALPEADRQDAVKIIGNLKSQLAAGPTTGSKLAALPEEIKARIKAIP